MTFNPKNRVMETTTTTGTGTVTLAGAVTGFQTWAAIVDGNTAPYHIEAVDGNGTPTGAWECGIGTYTASGTTLARTTVRASSNSGSAVSFAAGTKRVACSPQVEDLAFLAVSNVFTGNTQTIQADNSVTLVLRSSVQNNVPKMQMWFSRGTLASPAAITAGDSFMILSGVGQVDASTSASGASFYFQATQTWSSSQRGTKIVIDGVSDGATSVANWLVLQNAAITTGTWNATAIGAAYGGTGQTTYAVGDILYASAATPVLSKLAAAATGNALISAGINTAPSWGKVGLTTHISGTLGAANGGTGVANNAASTITISGNFATTLTVSNTTSVTLPTTGTLATLAGSESLTNKKLGSLTANGYVKTSAGDGTLSVDTNPPLLLAATNSSGATATAGDAGYIDTDGSYNRTTTANLVTRWCVVVVGGANGATIYVARAGNVTVTLNANCAAGNYLSTSTTAGQAAVNTSFRPECFAVCLTANVGGAGGTCTALLLCNTQFVVATDPNYIWGVSAADKSLFVATINGAPSTTAVTFNAPSSGNKNVLVPLAGSWGKLRIWNTTRNTSRLITSVNTGTNVITTPATTDAWANGDTLTMESQTVTTGAAAKVFELDISDATGLAAIPALTRSVVLQILTQDTNATNKFGGVHPYESYGNAKLIGAYSQVLSIYINCIVTINLLSRVIGVYWDAGASTSHILLVGLTGYFQAVP